MGHDIRLQAVGIRLALFTLARQGLVVRVARLRAGVGANVGDAAACTGVRARRMWTLRRRARRAVVGTAAFRKADTDRVSA